MKEKNEDEIRQSVRENYAKIATSSGASGCCSGTSCCTPAGSNFTPDTSVTLGYSKEDLGSVPEGANMGLGCGNPQAIASLNPGETVVDLGSGGGFDCFLASRQVGKTGKVIGIDMTPDMVSKARRNAEKGAFTNVEFRLGEIENLPVADNYADIIMSNCVINLSPNKQRVYNEAFRVLKNNGRLAISDVIAIREIPDNLKNDKNALCNCISGAVSKEKIEQMLMDSGFTKVNVTLNTGSKEFIKDWSPGSSAESFVVSADIQAVKK